MTDLRTLTEEEEDRIIQRVLGETIEKKRIVEDTTNQTEPRRSKRIQGKYQEPLLERAKKIKNLLNTTDYVSIRE